MKKTVFVLGAGASKEFGLPLGWELKDSIVTLLGTLDSTDDFYRDGQFHRAARRVHEDAAKIVTASKTIRRGIHYRASIDDFLRDFRHRPAVARLGRLAIAEIILGAERTAGALVDLGSRDLNLRSRRARDLSDVWIGRLFRSLFSGRTPEEAAETFRDVSFIVFNYDRCLQQYIKTAVADAFSLSNAEAVAIARQVRIEHVYGSLGKLPFEEDGGVPFGAEYADLNALSERIRTYGEEGDHGAAKERIAALMAQAERVVFLGYSFHAQGLDLLLPKGPVAGVSYLTTEFNLGVEAQERLVGFFAQHDLIRHGGPCSDLVARYLHVIRA